MEKGIRLKGGTLQSQEEKKQKNGKLFRKKPFKSVGSFMNKVIRTLGAFTHFGGVDARDPEDDDGGFRDGTPCTCTPSANSGVLIKEDGSVVVGVTTSSHRSSVREKLIWYHGDKIPGVLGLKNHGNTCFMNAVVQCLSNTDLLAEYLGLERYKLDLCQTRINGVVKSDETQLAKGEVTEQLASLVRALWTLEYTPQMSVEFKTTVSKYGSQFRGNSQHDALEFLLWLLDRVHEDVNLHPCINNNSIKAPPGKEPGEAEEAPPADPAQPQRSPSGECHSFVQEHFQAQYKSSLTCPHCLKQSNTFDPFLCISLPIPLRHTRPVYVTLVFSTKGLRYVRAGLAVPLLGSLSCLRRMVAEEGHISPEQVILTEIYSTGFERSFFDEDDLTCISENDVIYAFQGPPLYTRASSARTSGYHHSLPSSPFTSGPQGLRLPPSGTLSSEFLNQGFPMRILLLVCNTAGSGTQAVRFGPPFLMREDRAISWDQLQQSILSKMYYLMINGAQAQNARVLFNVRVVGGPPGLAPYSYLSPQDVRPLYHPAVESALRLCGSGGPPHVKLIIEWEHRIKDCLFGNIQEEVVKDAESVRNQQQQHVQQHSCTLDDCFQLYTKEEQLAPDDAWRCPHCRQLQQGMVKMSLWTLPDILILHLKRFRQVAERRNKLTTLVTFPLVGLDMAPHVVKRGRYAHLTAPPGPPLPGSKSCQTPESAPANYLYDLYAVCNHHGGLHGGHYTAFCMNSVDGQWYSYDDSSTESVPHTEVCTRGAYILFYHRRNNVPCWSASSTSPATSGSSSSSALGHWLVRLRGSGERDSLGSGGSLSGPAGSTTILDSQELPVFREEPAKAVETNRFEAKPFVRGSQTRSLSMRSPIKTKDTLSKVLPLRWSFGARERSKPTALGHPGELVEYLESGRRPRCTKEPITSLVATPPLGKAAQARTSSEAGLRDPGCPPGNSNCHSPKRPEGQSRAGAERRHGCDKTMEDGCLMPIKMDPGRAVDLQTQRGVILGGHVSHSAPPSRDSTLRKANGHTGLPSAAQRNPFHAIASPVGRKEMSRAEGRSQESLLSFLRPAFMRRDVQRTASPAQDRRVGSHGHPEKLSNGHLPTAPRCNGTLTPVAQEDRRAEARGGKATLANGKTARCDDRCVGLERAHSSGSIQGRPEPSPRGCASLQRNREITPPLHPQLRRISEKPASHVPPQYSTTSLGRQSTGLGVRF